MPDSGFAFVAALIDGVIMGVAIGVLLIPLFFLTGMAALITEWLERHGQPDPAVISSLIVMIACVLHAVSLLDPVALPRLSGERRKARHLGKAGRWGCTVTDLLGNPITFGRASGRFFAKMVTGMIPLGIGYIMAGFTERKQALHDMIASCLVLRR